jgi:hypothetical protein
MAKLNNQGNHNGPGLPSRDTSIATPAIDEGEVEASVTLLAPLEGEEQGSTSTSREEITIRTINTTSAAMTSKEWDTMEKEFSLTRLRNCCADPGGFVRAGEVRIANLIYLNGYVPFCVKNIQDRLTPCSTRHFTIVTNNTRTREMPLAIEHHQILNTE